MPDDLDQPPRAYTTADVASQPEPTRKRMGWRAKIWLSLLVIVCVAVLAFAAYTWSALHFAYSRGDRAGFVQKITKEGVVCKTWEGQIAMANLPGTTPEMFDFTVRSDSVAREIQNSLGKRVDITYEEHQGLPTSCFGRTKYFATGVRSAPQ
jgi:hypothetical protein